MATTPASRRTLDFSSLDEVLRDAENLSRGHTTVGIWTLGQIFYHLATAIRGSRRRRPGAASLPVDEAFRRRVFESRRRRPGAASLPVDEAFRRRVFESRRFPEGVPAPHPKLVPPGDADVAVQLEALREAILQWSLAAGPFPDHPMMGPLSKDEWTQFHCVHSAHHLGFAVPSKDAS